MWGDFGKPQRTVVRFHTGQVIMSICTKLHNKKHVRAYTGPSSSSVAARRSTFLRSNFTKFNVEEFEDMVAEKQIIPDSLWGQIYP